MFDSLNRLRDFLYDNNYTQDALRISDAITEYEKSLLNLLILKIKLLLQTIFIALLMLWQNDYYSNGKPIQGHHTFSVSKYPHLAGKGEGIYPATDNEHLNG